MHPLLNIAADAAIAASKIILRSLDNLDKITIENKARNDFVTEIDKKSEQIIIDTIHKAYPKHAILSEEIGSLEGTEDYLWIIDPLDGTVNYIHGNPHFSISIGIKHKNKLQHGLVYDPLRQEMFHATNGNGAFLNNKRIRVSAHKELTGSLLSTGLAHNQMEYMESYFKVLKPMLLPTAGIRRSGSAALDLAYVASGRLDGMWQFALRPWDIAAGAVIVQEAGGVVKDCSGKENYWEKGNIVGGNPKIVNDMLAVIKEHYQEGTKEMQC
jgi:myo-inositol-1(or 4)-monophosphatase